MNDVRIRVPLPLVQAWGWFGDRVNVPVWQHGQYQVLRIDILMAILGLFCTAFAWAAYGWQGAVQGSVAFVTIAALALLYRRG